MTEHYNKITGIAYQGGNQAECLSAGFTSPEWATFIQWQGLGFKVKKGEHGTRIKIVKKFNDDTQLEDKTIVKTAVIFNAEQVEEVKND